MPLDGTNYQTEQQDEVLALLRRARERVAKGWCQGEAESVDGGVCMLGAIHDICRGHQTNQWMLRRDAWLLLCEPLPHRDGVIYNDAPGRTQAEIVALFDRAIARREGEPENP